MELFAVMWYEVACHMLVRTVQLPLNKGKKINRANLLFSDKNN